MDVEVRELRTLDELGAAAHVLNTIWGTQQVTREILRALSFSGNPVIGALESGEVIGASFGFVGVNGGLHLHSHITGVLPGREHGGIGYELKLAQRRWCLDRGIERVSWTFDPMIARNAYFNLHKLGATAGRILPNFYGSMTDDFNRGDEADRLEAIWVVSSPRVLHALEDKEPEDTGVERVVEVPDDYLELRAENPVRAREERLRVRAELEDAFAGGLVATAFERGRGYLLSR